MKTAILSLFCLLCSLQLVAQSDSLTAKAILESRIYILDSATAPNSAKIFPMDDNYSYVQFHNGEAVLSWRVRGQTFFYKGKVRGIEIRKNDRGTSCTYCYLIPDVTSSTTKPMSIEIRELPSGKTELHIYQKLSGMDRLFISHIGKYADIAPYR